MFHQRRTCCLPTDHLQLRIVTIRGPGIVVTQVMSHSLAYLHHHNNALSVISRCLMNNTNIKLSRFRTATKMIFKKKY